MKKKQHNGGKMENLYDILEVSSKASKEVIDRAYKTLAKKYHPDLHTGADKAKAEEMMKKINYAYSILGDEAKKAEYDESLEKEHEVNQETSKYKEDKVNYEDNYNYTYKVTHKWTLKKIKTIFIVALIVLAIFGILWIIPSTRNSLIELYKNNSLVKLVVDLIRGIILGIGKFIKLLLGIKG